MIIVRQLQGEFWKEKNNTTALCTKWDNNSYGQKDEENDMWGQIQTRTGDVQLNELWS